MPDVQYFIQLGEFSYRIQQSHSYQEAFQALDELVISLGYSGVLYTYIPSFKLTNENISNPIYSVSDSYNPAFINHGDFQASCPNYFTRLVSQSA